MPQLLPFRGLLYDERAVPDLGAVICPPYDVIDAAARARLAARDPRNAVHVELPVGPGAGVPSDAAYRHAGELFSAWRADGTLRRDDKPLIYVYEQVYRRADDVSAACRGFYCRLRLEDPGPDSAIRPHERTLPAPKEDRFRLMRALRANLSPVLLLYQSAAGGAAAAELLGRLMAGSPEWEARADDGVVHRLWAADPTGEAAAADLLALAGVDALTIADGHHRYATALRHRDEVGGPGSDNVLALLYDAGSGGLSLEPTHRVLERVGDMEALWDGLAADFTVQPVNDRTALADALREGGLGLWSRRRGAWLGPRRPELAVAVLSAALARLLGADELDLEQQGRLWYTRDTAQALASVDDGRADACFLLDATPIQTVIDHAARGEVMPPKSTYFRPKAATGLVFNPLD